MKFQIPKAQDLFGIHAHGDSKIIKKQNGKMLLKNGDVAKEFNQNITHY